MRYTLAVTIMVGLTLAMGVMAAGCATDNLRTNGYKAFGGYVIAEQTAAAVVKDKNTPKAVVLKIQAIVKVSAPAAEALYANLTAYAALQDEIAGVKAAGGTPSAALAVKAQLALTALQKSYDLTLPKISELILAVNSFKKGK